MRERKRQQTRQAIASAGLGLFLQQGYDGTTLDQIAAAAGISRRSFFAYFPSKEELLLSAANTGFVEALRTAFAAVPAATLRPVEAMCRELPKLVSRFESEESLAIDRLLRSSETLRARKQAVFMEMENNLSDALAARWRDTDPQALRLVAMSGIGALRLAMDAWRGDHRQAALSVHLDRQLALLRQSVGA